MKFESNKTIRQKHRHLKSPRSLTVSSAFHSWEIVPRWKSNKNPMWGSLVKILSTPVPFVPYNRASYPPLPSLSFHDHNDNRASHSRDTILPWKVKVKGQGQRYPSQCSIQLTHFLSVSHQDIPLTPIPFVSWQSGLPFPRYDLTLKIHGQRSRSKVPQSAQRPVDSFP